MTGADRIIFVYGVFATLLLIAGLLYTIREFREINRHPEKFAHNPFLVNSPEKENTGD